MKRILLAAMAMLGSAAAQAQYAPGTLSVKPMVGMTYSTNYSQSLYSEKYEAATWKLGLAAGAEIDYQVLKFLNVSVGVTYSQQGFYPKNQYWPYHEDEYDYHSRWIHILGKKYSLDYVSLPLIVSAYPVKGLALKIGYQFDWLTKARERTRYMYETSDQVPLSDVKEVNNDVSYQYKKKNNSLLFGISYEWKGFVADLRYTIGLSRAKTETYMARPEDYPYRFLSEWSTGKILQLKNKNNALLLTLGYKLPLVKGKMKPKKEETGGKQYIYESYP